MTLTPVPTADARPSPEQPARSAAPAPARHVRALVAEDHIVNQTVARRMLEHAGYEIMLAVNGVEAVASFRRNAPDVILMDLEMPEMGGLEATQTIRRIEAANGGHVPIIAVTAHAMTGDREKCLSFGMDGYVSKPIRRADLLAELERCLGRGDPPPVKP
ncbi:MAG: response regulator [Acidobacteria bacterium]|nr:response regulator [Acidobacteriota bacterium]